MSAIKVTNLSKTFDYYKKEQGLKNSLKNLFHRERLTKEAVKGATFEIEEGKIVGFLGPNGAGKTTTLKMLSGILYPTSGSASVLGYVPWERKIGFKKQFSIIIGQKNQLWWDLPAIESLYINKCIYEVDDREYKNTVEELSELLDVKDLLNVQVRRLSLGERMKMEVIAALIHKPKLILLDEPTIGLDVIAQKKIREFFKAYNQERKATIILTSHYMNDVEEMCKRTIIINHGKIIYDGELGKINELLSGTKIVKLQLSDYVSREVLKSMGTIREYDGLNATIEADRQEIKKISRIMLENLPVVDFNIEDVPIEESIAILYQKDGEEENEMVQKVF